MILFIQVHIFYLYHIMLTLKIIKKHLPISNLFKEIQFSHNLNVYNIMENN